jgi:hypothetical protein
MRLPPFLRGRPSVHPEHPGRDHVDDDIRLVRLEYRQMAQVTIVVRVGFVAKWRLRAAMALMRIAGRIGGFKNVKLIREDAR